MKLSMSLPLRILVGYFLIVGLTGLFVLLIVVREVRPSVRESIEESMVDTANLLAALAADDLKSGHIATGAFAQRVREYPQRQIDARIWHFRKTTLDYRILVTDVQGVVVFDSSGVAQGQDYSRWNDVRRTLRGEYGARSTRTDEQDDRSTVFNVAAPVLDGQQIIGVLTVAKPIAGVDPIIARAERTITRYGLALVGSALALGLFVTIRLSLAVRRLQHYAREVSEGRRAEVPHSGARELNDLAQAMARMRASLDGKQYVERYVEALTHELKSPLAAAHGAAELLTEPSLPEAQRAHFTQRVLEQTRRMQSAIERLLELSRLEARATPIQDAVFDAGALLAKVADERSGRAEQAGVNLTLAPPTRSLQARGDTALIAFALGNLIDNAIDFSRRGGRVALQVADEAGELVFSVRDEGAGIPDYATERIFERFYSLARPDGSYKGSGLGLAFVREIAALHRGRVAVSNQPGGGVLATLHLPTAG